MKPRRLLFSLVFILLASAAQAGINGFEVKTRKKGRVFIISIGLSSSTSNNSYGSGDTAFLLNEPCPVCLTDARGLPDYFKALQKKIPKTIDSVVSIDVKKWSVKALYHAFASVQLHSGPDDIFVFYYAAISWGNRFNSDKNGYEGYYNMTDGNGAFDAEGSFTLTDLKTLTDRIAAQRQLIIFDTGSGEVIQKDYYQNFYSDNPAQARFTKKERIFICPEDFSTESRTADGTVKGDIFRIISSMPDLLNVFTLFEEKQKGTQKNTDYKRFMQRWYQEQQQCVASIKILREQQYLDMLMAIKPMGETGKRGNILLASKLEKNKEVLTRNRKALVIATNQYSSAMQWPSLKNAVNDGVAVADILRKQGYEVITLFDQPQDSVLEAVSLFCSNSTSPYDQNVLYIAGHGYYDARQQAGYVVCKDSRQFKDPARPSASELNSYLDYTVLFRNMEQLNKVVLITDVCFGGTAMNSMLQSKTMANPDKDASSEKNPYKRVLSSGVKEVDDFVRLQNGNASNHSPFAYALINAFAVNKTDLSFELLFDAISKAKLEPRPVEFYFGENMKPNEFKF